jgi:mRNA interferase MazF
MKKGEIWLVELPTTISKEQAGNRPAVVIAEVDAGMAIVVPLTSNLQALKFKNTLSLVPSSMNGLKQASVILIFQIRAIDGKRLIKKEGNLETNTMQEVQTMIKSMLKL